MATQTSNVRLPMRMELTDGSARRVARYLYELLKEDSSLLPEEYLTRKEAAKFIGVSVRFLVYHPDTIGFRIVNNKAMYRKKDLIAYMEGR